MPAASIVWLIVGLIIGVWRVRAWNAHLNACYPRVAGPLFHWYDLVILPVWAISWPLGLLVELIPSSAFCMKCRSRRF